MGPSGLSLPHLPMNLSWNDLSDWPHRGDEWSEALSTAEWEAFVRRSETVDLNRQQLEQAWAIPA
jgi:hypothetical protein